MMLQGGKKVVWHKQVWSRKLPIKKRLFQWKLGWNRISTMDRVKEYEPDDRDTCMFCRYYKETSEHLFLECGIISAVWTQFFMLIGMQWKRGNSILDLIME